MENLSVEMLKAVKDLGDLIKADPRYTAVTTAEQNYSENPEIQKALTEYSVQQAALADACSQKEQDTALVDSIQKRISELYTMIMDHPVYVAYKEASDEYQAFYGAVNAELEYVLTGRRPSGCTHDCSTCSGCH